MSDARLCSEVFRSQPQTLRKVPFFLHLTVILNIVLSFKYWKMNRIIKKYFSIKKKCKWHISIWKVLTIKEMQINRRVLTFYQIDTVKKKRWTFFGPRMGHTLAGDSSSHAGPSCSAPARCDLAAQLRPSQPWNLAKATLVPYPSQVSSSDMLYMILYIFSCFTS